MDLRLLPAISALALSFVVASPRAATASEARAFWLSDGRLIAGIVVETRADAMVVRTAQGLRTVPYAGLSGIDNISEEEVWNQPPLVVLAAPAVGPGKERVDELIGRAVQLLPKVRAVDATAQNEDLRACRAQSECLRPLVLGWGAAVLWVPEIEAGGSHLKLRAIFPSSGAELGSTRLSLTDGDDVVGPAVAEALFTTMGVQPEFDVRAVASAIFPRAAGPAVPAPPASPAPVVAPTPAPPAVVQVPPTPTEAATAAAPPTEPPTVAAAPPTEEPKASTAPAPAPASPPVTPVATAPASRSQPTRVAPTSRSATPTWATDPKRLHLLAFVPVPGLGPALLKDPGAFVLSAGGGVAVAWAGVYGVGREARTAPAFWAPSIAISYASAVVFNQIGTAIALRKRR